MSENSATSNQTREITQQFTSMMRVSENITLAVKLDGRNYPLWSRLMRVAVGGRGKTSHLTGIPPPPPTDDPNYYQWEENDLTVFSWLINNMETRLANNFAQHQTSKGIWDSLTITYGISTDPFQIYDLEVRANKVCQGTLPLEDYWNSLQTIWVNIDQRQPNPMGCCEEGIHKYKKIIENRRMYQFLAGLDDKFDGVRRDILKESPSPSAESAFAWAKREAARLLILKPATSSITHGGDSYTSSSGGIGTGLGVRNPGTRQDGYRPTHNRGPNPPPRSGNSSSRAKIDKSKLYCTHCGKHKHTKEMCFQLVGYPDWWDDKAKGQIAVGTDGGNFGEAATSVGNPRATGAEGSWIPSDYPANMEHTGRAARVTHKGEECAVNGGADSTERGKGFGAFALNPSTFPKLHSALSTSHNVYSAPVEHKNSKTNPFKIENISDAQHQHSFAYKAQTMPTDSGWIFDCGATDTMTYDQADLVEQSKPLRTHVQTANGDIVSVKGAGTIKISSNLKLSNCLYVPSLSQKLMSISHVTKELNCTLLMHPHFCLLQDIRTGEIIGRGTERRGLYYVDEIAQQGSVLLAHGSANREAWLWHRRLGIPPRVI